MNNEVGPVEFVEEDGIMQLKEKNRKGMQREVQSSFDTAKRGFLRLLIRCRRIILQDAAVYLHLNKENKHVNMKSHIFSSNSFKIFQEDIVAAITNPSISRLQEYEEIIPNIVDTHKEVASRVAEVNHRVLRLHHQQEKNESSFNNYAEQSNQQNLFLLNVTQQLASDIKIIMMQQQCLNSQMQLLMATNNPQPPAFHVFPAVPSIPPSSFSAPLALQPAPHPVAINPALYLNNKNRNITTSSKSKSQKKTRWVNYEPANSN